MVCILLRFIDDQRGTVSIEYVAIGALMALMLLAVLSRIFDSLRSSLQGVNSEL
ncbi:MAG: hypothetical protein ACE5II_06895 [Anaerolineae bacterium]